MSIRDDIGISSRMIWYSVLGFAIIAGITTLLLVLKPTWLGFEREAYISSHQYIEGHQTALMTLAAEIRQIDIRIASLGPEGGQGELARSLHLQRESLVDQLRMEASRIPDNEVPHDVRSILLGY